MNKHTTTGFLSLLVLLLLVISGSQAAGYSNDMDRVPTQTQADLDEQQPALGPTWYSKPATYATLISWYQNLAAQYPDYLEVIKGNELYGTGTVTGGYDIYYIRITNEALGLHKPEVLFLGGPHGDETVGTVGMFWFTDWMMRMTQTDEPCQEYDKDWLRWILDNREIYLEASHNPYGYDHGPERYDGNGWDLNREADLDGPGSPTGGVWASVNGKTLRQFVDHHQIRLALDFHGGARCLLYPWGSTHSSITGVSPVSGRTYTYAPPDFYFYDVSTLRLGSYIGDYGGDLGPSDVGTIPGTIGYSVQGGLSPWAYGADVLTNPVEDPYVNDETWGNYPGAGIHWISPEMSGTKNPSESTFGNDTVHRYGAEVRRTILHQADLAQPSVRLINGTIADNSVVLPQQAIPFVWQVNGSLVVDHTSIQYGTNPDPITNPQYFTTDYNAHAGQYVGGTGWDGANSGQTSGTTYVENIVPPTAGDYYFVVKAQVDQKYAEVLRPDVYHNNPYLRLVKERTNVSFHEVIDGTDGNEVMDGQLWWYSPVIHVIVAGGAPAKPATPEGPDRGKLHVEYTFTTTSTDPDNDDIYYQWNWGDGTLSPWLGPFPSGAVANASHAWTVRESYSIKVRARDWANLISDWSDPLVVPMTRELSAPHALLQWFLEHFPNAFPVLRYLLGV